VSVSEENLYSRLLREDEGLRASVIASHLSRSAGSRNSTFKNGLSEAIILCFKRLLSEGGEYLMKCYQVGLHGLYNAAVATS
jgi:hypothetical protein